MNALLYALSFVPIIGAPAVAALGYVDTARAASTAPPSEDAPPDRATPSEWSMLLVPLALIGGAVAIGLGIPLIGAYFGLVPKGNQLLRAFAAMFRATASVVVGLARAIPGIGKLL